MDDLGVLLFLVGAVGTWYFIKKKKDTQKRNISIGLILLGFLLIGIFSDTSEVEQSTVESTVESTSESTVYSSAPESSVVESITIESTVESVVINNAETFVESLKEKGYEVESYELSEGDLIIKMPYRDNFSKSARLGIAKGHTKEIWELMAMQPIEEVNNLTVQQYVVMEDNYGEKSDVDVYISSISSEKIYKIKYEGKTSGLVDEESDTLYVHPEYK